MQTLGFLLQISATDPHPGWDCVAIVDVIPGLVCLSPYLLPPVCYSPPFCVANVSLKVLLRSLAGKRSVFKKENFSNAHNNLLIFCVSLQRITNGIDNVAQSITLFSRSKEKCLNSHLYLSVCDIRNGKRF